MKSVASYQIDEFQHFLTRNISLLLTGIQLPDPIPLTGAEMLWFMIGQYTKFSESVTA